MDWRNANAGVVYSILTLGSFAGLNAKIPVVMRSKTTLSKH